jgi:3-isopropylmalate/(R)-2-methylmalate dehydratase small subunit
MKPFTQHEGVVAPLLRSQVDTDQILPARFLKRITRTGYEDCLFALWREQSDFILNQPAYKDATILIAGADFGIGSSREAAVWALSDYGFRVVIAPKFGDIFRSNAGKCGLLVIPLEEEMVTQLQNHFLQNPGETLTVDLERCSLALSKGVVAHFAIDETVRHKLLNGIDDIAETLREDAEISSFESRRPPFRPLISPGV